MTGHRDWTAQAREVLDASAAALDAATLARLTRARQQALAQRRMDRRWLPTGLATAAALALATLVWWPQSQPPPSGAAATAGTAAGVHADDTDLLSEDNLELAEDLEFYAWLADEEDSNG